MGDGVFLWLLAGVGALRSRPGVLEGQGFSGGAEWVTECQGWDGLPSLAFPLSQEGFLLELCWACWGELGLLCLHSMVPPKLGDFWKIL